MKKRDESLGAKRTVRYTTLPGGDYDSDDNNSWDKGSMNLIHHKIKSQNDNLDELINDIIKVGCNEIIKMLNKIQNELEATGQFINELKMIV